MRPALALVLFAAACSPSPYDWGDVPTAEGTMRGQVSTVPEFADGLSRNYNYRWGDQVQLEMHVEGEYGWVMVAGGFDLSGHAVGDTWDLSSEEVWNLYGCAGPMLYDYDYDDAPEEVTISLSTAPVGEDGTTDVSDEVLLTVEADFGVVGAVVATAPLPHDG